MRSQQKTAKTEKNQEVAVWAFYLETWRQTPKETDKRNENNCHKAGGKGKWGRWRVKELSPEKALLNNLVL